MGCLEPSTQTEGGHLPARPLLSQSCPFSQLRKFSGSSVTWSGGRYMAYMAYMLEWPEVK